MKTGQKQTAPASPANNTNTETDRATQLGQAILDLGNIGMSAAGLGTADLREAAALKRAEVSTTNPVVNQERLEGMKEFDRQNAEWSALKAKPNASHADNSDAQINQERQKSVGDFDRDARAWEAKRDFGNTQSPASLDAIQRNLSPFQYEERKEDKK